MRTDVRPRDRGARLAWAAAGVALCLAGAARAADPKPAEWIKLATQEVVFPNPRRLVTPGLFEDALQHEVALTMDGPAVDLGWPHEGADAKGQPLPPLRVAWRPSGLWVDLDGDGQPKPTEIFKLNAEGVTPVCKLPVSFRDGTGGTCACLFQMLRDAGDTSRPKGAGPAPVKFRLVRCAARVALFQNLQLVLLDENANGRFDDLGQDAIQLGEGPATYLSPRLLAGGRLYDVVVHPAGQTVELRPSAPVATGRVELFRRFAAPVSLSSLKVHTVIVEGPAGCFAFGTNCQGADLPCGAYDLRFGIFEQGRETVTVTKGLNTAFDVESGKVAAPAWGGPVSCRFLVQNETLDLGGRVSISRPALTGKAGEAYWPQDYRPLEIMVSVMKNWQVLEFDRVASYHTLLVHGKLSPGTDGRFRPASFEYREPRTGTEINPVIEATIELRSAILGALTDRQTIKK